MTKCFNILWTALFLVLGLFSLSFSEETFTITTYYPSPFGSYNQLTTTSNTYLATTGGNVGIGTTGPGAKLEVKSDSQHTIKLNPASASILIANNNVGLNAMATSLQFTQSSGLTTPYAQIGSGWESSTAESFISFHTTNDTGSTLPEQMRIDPNGNVGIGMVSPSAKLHIAGIGGTNASPGDTAIQFYDNTGTPANTFAMRIADFNGGTTEFQTINTTNFHLKAGINTGLYMNTTGNVGIGTVSPSRLLHLYSSTANVVQANQSTFGSSTLSLLDKDDTQYYSYINFGADTARGWQVGKSKNSGVGPDGGFYIYELTTATPGTRFAIAKGGNVGIGIINPSYRLEMPNIASPLGRGYANQWIDASSVRYKTNIKPIKNALDKLMELRGVSFNWKENGESGIGLIAEEVGKVIPEVVAYENNGKDAKGLSYDHLVALLIEAVKTQQREIENFKKEITELKINLRGRK